MKAAKRFIPGLFFSCLLLGQSGAVDFSSSGGAPSSAFVTTEHYAHFLNAVAATDAHHLYDEKMGLDEIMRTGSPGAYRYYAMQKNVPITYVSWNDAARYCNWMENDRLTLEADCEITEYGVYELREEELLSINPQAAHLLVAHENASAVFSVNDSLSSWGSPASIDGLCRPVIAMQCGAIISTQNESWLKSNRIGFALRGAANVCAASENAAYEDGEWIGGGVVLAALLFGGGYYCSRVAEHDFSSRSAASAEEERAGWSYATPQYLSDRNDSLKLRHALTLQNPATMHQESSLFYKVIDGASGLEPASTILSNHARSEFDSNSVSPGTPIGSALKGSTKVLIYDPEKEKIKRIEKKKAISFKQVQELAQETASSILKIGIEGIEKVKDRKIDLLYGEPASLILSEVMEEIVQEIVSARLQYKSSLSEDLKKAEIGFSWARKNSISKPELQMLSTWLETAQQRKEKIIAEEPERYFQILRQMAEVYANAAQKEQERDEKYRIYEETRRRVTNSKAEGDAYEQARQKAIDVAHSAHKLSQGSIEVIKPEVKEPKLPKAQSWHFFENSDAARKRSLPSNASIKRSQTCNNFFENNDAVSERNGFDQMFSKYNSSEK